MTSLNVSTVARFRTAVDERDLDAVAPLLAEDVRFFSPVKFRPFEGRPMAVAVFGVLLTRVFEEFRYVGDLGGMVETSAGDPAESHILVFRAQVAGKQVHGIDLIQLDGQGRIGEFTVMVRPQSAVTALSDAVLAGLAAEGYA